MSLTIHGWSGHGTARLSVEVPAGTVVRLRVPDPWALLDRIAGLHGPRLWIRVDGHACGRVAPHLRVRRGLATVDGRLPVTEAMTVRDLLLLGRPAPGRFGFLGLGRAQQRERDEREAAARALAGTLGLGPVLESSLADLDARQALLADLGRALLGEPAALVAAPDAAHLPDMEALLAQAVRRGPLAALLLVPGPFEASGDRSLGEALNTSRPPGG